MFDEIEMYQEGATYFDEDFECLKNKKAYKHEQLLNTGIWWFRNNQKFISIFTNVLASEDYLYDVLKKDTIATVYYNKLAYGLDLDRVIANYNNGGVVFKKINFVPSDEMIYKTRLGKEIPYATIVLASDDTIIFDKKYLGLKKDISGDRSVYRVKDKIIFKRMKEQFDHLLSNDN